ncbi:ankyrin repeat-containing domain protein [Aspergillus desertorum]
MPVTQEDAPRNLAKNTVPSGRVIEFNDKHKACLTKLFVTDPGEDLNRLKRRKGDRTSGTFSWFLESDQLKSWFRQAELMSDIEQNVLWLYGSPGIGKSTMAMTLAEELPKKDYFSDRDSILSFFFCDSGSEHQRTATSILRGLLYQIIKQCPPSIEQLMSKFDIQGERLFTSFDALWTVLMDIGRVSRGAEIYCIVDALDECEIESQETLLQQIYQSFRKATNTSLVTSSVHFLIVSRPYPEIADCLSIFQCVDLGSYKEITNDLKTMIQDRVQDLARQKKYCKRLAQNVSRLLEEKADGTFLWVGIACEELKRVPSKDAVKVLEARPRGLYPLYQTLLSAAVTASSPNDYPHVKALLVVVTFALRPLAIAEIAEACRLYLDEEISSRLQFTREIIDLCRLLVVVDNGYVRLLHTSVQDFLMAEMHEIKAAKSNYAIACRCIEVIFQNGRPGMDRSALEPTRGFLGYSVLHWPQHASLAQTEFTVQSKHEQFFQDVLETWSTWLDNYSYLKRGSWGALETGLSAIHVAARWGIIPLMSTLLLQEKLEDKDARGQSPLLIAAENTQLEAMRVLLESGAHVNSLNNEHQNVLHIACKNRRFNDHSMIKLLVDKGASLYVCDRDNMTPFLYAIGEQDEGLAQAFLQNGFDLTIGARRQPWPRRTITRSFAYTLSKHQEKGSPVDGESGLTALHFSALNACTEMTAFLLQHGADPNARSGFGDTALHLGIRRKVLGAECDDVWESEQYAVESLKEIITDHEGSEASDIYQAIDIARIKIVETLLKSESINVNMANSQGDYPQHVINFDKYYALSILDKLVEKGADMSRPNGAHQTCFHLASKAGNLEVVRRFVNEGHDIMLQDADGLSPFHYAASEGHLDILHFMSKNCDHVLPEVCHSFDHLGKSPLHHHVQSEYCSAEVVRLLIQLGCDVNQPDMEGNSPLGLYMDSFHISVRTDIFWLLALEGADLNWVNKKRQNLAHLLMHHSGAHEVILDVLFGIGLDPAATDLDGRTLMHHGAIHGMFTKGLVEFLKCRGALDLHTRDLIGKTPLNYAEEEANREFPEDTFLEHHGQQESYESLKAMSHILL